jgi:hypothetical protein
MEPGSAHRAIRGFGSELWWEDNGTCTHAAQRYMGSGNTLTMFGLLGPTTPQQILSSFIHVGYEALTPVPSETAR